MRSYDVINSSSTISPASSIPQKDGSSTLHIVIQNLLMCFLYHTICFRSDSHIRKPHTLNPPPWLINELAGWVCCCFWSRGQSATLLTDALTINEFNSKPYTLNLPPWLINELAGRVCCCFWSWGTGRNGWLRELHLLTDARTINEFKLTHLIHV
jgi:hypothetical protein